MTLDEANAQAEVLGRRYGKSGWGCVKNDGVWLVGPVRDDFCETTYGYGPTTTNALDRAEGFLQSFCTPVEASESEDLLAAARMMPSEILRAVLAERGEAP